MPSPTPDSNKIDITQLRGDLNTFRAEVKGSISKTEQSVEVIKDAVVDIKDGFKEHLAAQERGTIRVWQKLDSNELVGVENKKELEMHMEVLKARRDETRSMAGWMKWGLGIAASISLAFMGWLFNHFSHGK